MLIASVRSVGFKNVLATAPADRLAGRDVTSSFEHHEGDEERSASHILFMADASQSDEEFEKVRQKASDVLKDIKKDPKKFEGVLKTHSFIVHLIRSKRMIQLLNIKKETWY